MCRYYTRSFIVQFPWQILYVFVEFLSMNLLIHVDIWFCISLKLTLADYVQSISWISFFFLFIYSSTGMLDKEFVTSVDLSYHMKNYENCTPMIVRFRCQMSFTFVVCVGNVWCECTDEICCLWFTCRM